jgi:NAD(P)-dependent dehydrogenase (short-subunit alcohol dehydrogenase family)
VLVNNAACDQRQQFAELTEQEFDWMIAVNLRHVVFAAQAVAPQMQSLGYGSIVNLTSVAWMRGVVDVQAYSAAKAGIVGFTNSLARQLGGSRIRVNAVAPGLVLTERQRKQWFSDEDKIAASMAPQAIRDPIEPEDVSALVMFLAADDSRMITKQCISVNAGSL